MFEFLKNKIFKSCKIFLIFINRPFIFFVLFGLIFYNFMISSYYVCNAEETIIPILTYHNFTKNESTDYQINIQEFEKQMHYLVSNNYSIISLSELIIGLKDGKLPDNPVAITIDDGYKSTYTLAYPILKKYNIPATLFIYTDFIERNSASLTWGEIREMMTSNIEIGSHTLSHCNLLHYKENEEHDRYLSRIKKELALSKEIIENKTGKTVKFFAYPYGVYSSLVQDLAIEAGYLGTFNVNNMNNTINNNPKNLNRQIIFGNASFDAFIKKLKQEPLIILKIFPEDGTVSHDQHIKIGALLNDSNINENTLSLKLGGAKVNFIFNPENKEISFAPRPDKPLIKKSYIVYVSAHDNNINCVRQTSWLITIK